jgi:hypothetical protein
VQDFVDEDSQKHVKLERDEENVINVVPVSKHGRWYGTQWNTWASPKVSLMPELFIAVSLVFVFELRENTDDYPIERSTREEIGAFICHMLESGMSAGHHD